MIWPNLRMTLIERVVICMIAFMLINLFQFTFSGMAMLFTAGGLCVFLAMTSERALLSKIWFSLSVASIACGSIELSELRPLARKISGQKFENATLTEVLQFVAVQKSKMPVWRFYIYDQELADRRVTLTIPHETTLGDVMCLISSSVDCDFGYRWHKACGNATTPMAAEFSITSKGTSPRRRSEAAVIISDDHIWQPKKPDTLTPSPVPPSPPAANP